MTDAIKVGTRGSALAMRQTADVIDALLRQDRSLRFKTVVVETSGDALPRAPIESIPGKGRFTKALEDKLLAGTIASWLEADPSLRRLEGAGWNGRARFLLELFALWLQGWAPHGPQCVHTLLAPPRVAQVFRSAALERLDELGLLSRPQRAEAGRLIDEFIEAAAIPQPQFAGQNAPRSPRRT